jgi:hypothetical protein
METYLLKASLSLIILYGFYRITLRFEFDHQLNRFLGLTCILFSTNFPFIEFKDIPQPNELPEALYFVAKGTADFQETVSSATANNAISIVLLLYAIGVSIFLLRCLYGLATLLWLYFNSPKSYQKGFTIVTLDRTISPFTFFNVLFIGNDRIEDSEMEMTLLHERVHRNQYHSIDAVVLEVMSIVFWFNPAIWLFRRDVRAQHEYYADECVLEKGINPIDYQLMLFKVQTGTSIELGNYLSNGTRLIKRFNMMTKTKPKAKDSYLRVSLLIVLMSVILFLGAFSGRNEGAQIDKIATYERGEQVMYETILKRIAYPVNARSENRSGLVLVSFTVTESGDVVNVQAETREDGFLLSEIVVVGWSKSSQDAKGINDALKAAAVQAVEGLGKFVPARKDSKRVKSVLMLPIKFKLEQK